MKFSDVINNIGKKVHLNGRGDLAIYRDFRPYIYPCPEIPYVFTIIKITRSGKVYIQCDRNKKFLTVNTVNIDLIESEETK